MPAKLAVSEYFSADSENGVFGGIEQMERSRTGSMGNVTTAKEAPDPSGEHLCPDEVMAAVSSLSGVDKLKLDAIEGYKRRGTGFQRGQLLHETYCLVLLGQRKCPRAVPIMAFLVQTMKSIASHERERRKRTVSLHAVAREGEAVPAATAATAAVDTAAQGIFERLERSPETVSEIVNLFDGDEAAQLVIMAWADGCRGADLREATDLDQAGVDYAAKRIRKKMRALYPNGWTE